jgi:hypothetical protein
MLLFGTLVTRPLTFHAARPTDRRDSGTSETSGLDADEFDFPEGYRSFLFLAEIRPCLMPGFPMGINDFDPRPDEDLLIIPYLALRLMKRPALSSDSGERETFVIFYQVFARKRVRCCFDHLPISPLNVHWGYSISVRQ